MFLVLLKLAPERAEDPPLIVGQSGLKGSFELHHLFAQSPTRERREDFRVVHAFLKRLQNLTSRATKDVRAHRRELDSGGLEQLNRCDSCPGRSMADLDAKTSELPQGLLVGVG